MLIPYKKPSYITRIFVIFSQSLNVIFFDGFPDEMLSARCYRQQADLTWAKRKSFIDKLFYWQVDHCKQCFEWEEARVDSPGEYKDDIIA